MKKILTIVCCAMALLSVSSCTKQYVTPNPNVSEIFTVAPSDWSLYTVDNKSYMAPISVTDISKDFANYGGVIVAISYSDGVYEQLPEVYNGVSYSYTYNDGNVTIYSQSADGTTAIAPTQSLNVKVTLVATQ
ncbi:MAG: hypothetical protein ACTHJ8_03685 [Mucilaginibacter sp.]|jgi:hypothetical protein